MLGGYGDVMGFRQLGVEKLRASKVVWGLGFKA